MLLLVGIVANHVAALVDGDTHQAAGGIPILGQARLIEVVAELGATRQIEGDFQIRSAVIQVGRRNRKHGRRIFDRIICSQISDIRRISGTRRIFGRICTIRSDRERSVGGEGDHRRSRITSNVFRGNILPIQRCINLPLAKA
ncbi:hypothetical protein D3C78_1542080 [compost metagenome]